MHIEEQVFTELKNFAIEGGATAVRPISPKDVVLAQWVREKCKYGCSAFGKRFTCPPYAPTPHETADTLKDYHEALLVEFANMSRDKLRRDETARRMVQDVLYGMEKKAFLSGYERAFSYKAGPCRLCPECPAEKLENPNLFSMKDCKNPKEARPAMEAAGMDVYSTVRKAGFELNVVRDRSEPFKCFGLVLLE